MADRLNELHRERAELAQHGHVREMIPVQLAIVAETESTCRIRDMANAWNCKVNDEEFEKAKHVEDNVVLTESAMSGQEVAIAFKPREEWPKPFKFYRLFR
jgi:hypothetical protein